MNVFLEVILSLEPRFTRVTTVGPHFEVNPGNVAPQFVDVREFLAAVLTFLFQVIMRSLDVELQSTLGHETLLQAKLTESWG